MLGEMTITIEPEITEEREFIINMYRAYLGREPAEWEIQERLNALAGGYTLDRQKTDIAQAPESVQHRADYKNAGRTKHNNLVWEVAGRCHRNTNRHPGKIARYTLNPFQLCPNHAWLPLASTPD